MIKNEDIEESIKNEKRKKEEESKNNEEKKNEEKEAKNNIKDNEKLEGTIEPKVLKGIIPPTKRKLTVFEDPLDNILYNINRYVLLVNKLDHYGNSIPLGSFCFGISFIIIGLFDCHAHKNPDKFLHIILLLFGGCGQVIAGILEYIKGRSFSSNLYLIYGIYFISQFLLKYPAEKKKFEPKDCYPFFYGSWAGLTFPLFIGSIKVNVMYLIQTLIGCVFFVIRCIGEYKDSNEKMEITSGILELVIGVVSLYICFSQIINETLGFQLLPCITLQQDNDIDFASNNDEKKEISN